MWSGAQKLLGLSVVLLPKFRELVFQDAHHAKAATVIVGTVVGLAVSLFLSYQCCSIQRCCSTC